MVGRHGPVWPGELNVREVPAEVGLAWLHAGPILAGLTDVRPTTAQHQPPAQPCGQGRALTLPAHLGAGVTRTLPRSLSIEESSMYRSKSTVSRSALLGTPRRPKRLGQSGVTEGIWDRAGREVLVGAGEQDKVA